jgi:hypothetical protein
MGLGLSMDLRRRVVMAVLDEGVHRRGAAPRFGITPSPYLPINQPRHQDNHARLSGLNVSIRQGGLLHGTTAAQGGCQRTFV